MTRNLKTTEARNGILYVTDLTYPHKSSYEEIACGARYKRATQFRSLEVSCRRHLTFRTFVVAGTEVNAPCIKLGTKRPRQQRRDLPGHG